MRYLLISTILLCPIFFFGQFTVNAPLPNTGIYSITDSVYMDPNGNDLNPGTFALPVKSWNAAMQKLPYGVLGINNGNAYGVIKMKAGYYETMAGFHQNTSNWKNGNVYRNISVEGMGDVVIGGSPTSYATGHLLFLSGDHIYIKNIKLKYSNGIGLLLNRTEVKRQSNVLIDGVLIDSVGNFSMLLNNVDSILVRESKSLYSSRPGNDTLVSPCQWPSGIKFLGCKDATIYNSEIAYTRGEGLNFQNTLRGLAHHNRIHDNGLNLYNDNSAKLMVHSNLIYNTPGIGSQYWRNCPADTNKIWSGGGFLIANEGSCFAGSLPTFNGCATVCKFPDESFSNVDSMFIYNNIIQNVGEAIGFWEGRTDIAGANCIRNVFIFNNTFIGAMGMFAAPNKFFINVYYPDYNVIFNSNYGYLQNVRITNNIFTYDTVTSPTMKPVRMVFHAFHPGPKDIKFDNNLWIQAHTFMQTNDLVRRNMPGATYLLTDSLKSIQPCPQATHWIYDGPVLFPFLTKDYNNKTRSSFFTNVGALEYNDTCNTIKSGINLRYSLKPTIFPNPCIDCEVLNIGNLSNHENYQYCLQAMDGRILEAGEIVNNQILLNKDYNGLYILFISNKWDTFTSKIFLRAK